MAGSLITEADMLKPVLQLFPRNRYKRLPEVPLGRKLVDLLCVPLNPFGQSVSVELKLRNWRQAVWQAIANFQLTDQSFVAIWHEFLHPVQKQAGLLEFYGLGLIVVKPGRAEVIRTSKDVVYRIARKDKAKFYAQLLSGQGKGL
jgi:hypothetical protein